MRLNTRFYVTVLLAGLMALTSTLAIAQQGGAKKRSGTRRARSKRSSSSNNSSKGLQKIKVTFNPTNKRDPMLSADDVLLLEYREKQRLAAQEAERKRREAEERKRREEEERKRQWELLLLRDPSIVVRDKIRISGIIDKEVLIGGKLYTIGNSYLGAKIVSVGADSVTFSYKGHKFVKKLQL